MNTRYHCQGMMHGGGVRTWSAVEWSPWCAGSIYSWVHREAEKEEEEEEEERRGKLNGVG